MSILNQKLIQREIFDPSNSLHLASFKNFLRTGNWGDVQFFAELPNIEVPMTVLTKFARHQLELSIETPAERAVRMAANPRLVMVPKSLTDEDHAANMKASNLLAKSMGLSVKIKN